MEVNRSTEPEPVLLTLSLLVLLFTFSILAFHFIDVGLGFGSGIYLCAGLLPPHFPWREDGKWETPLDSFSELWGSAIITEIIIIIRIIVSRSRSRSIPFPASIHYSLSPFASAFPSFSFRHELSAKQRIRRHHRHIRSDMIAVRIWVFRIRMSRGYMYIHEKYSGVVNEARPDRKHHDRHHIFFLFKYCRQCKYKNIGK